MAVKKLGIKETREDQIKLTFMWKREKKKRILWKMAEMWDKDTEEKELRWNGKNFKRKSLKMKKKESKKTWDEVKAGIYKRKKEEKDSGTKVKKKVT